MDWRSYGLSDFLMFSPQVYGRLLERYNQALWPAQAAFLALGIALLVVTARRSPARPLLPCLLLAAAWAMVGWGFHWQRYAEIFIAAPALAVACAAQALLLAGCAFMPPRELRPPAPIVRGLGAVLVAAGVLLYPLLPLLAGHGGWRAEVFGLVPDPTALATLGWLVATGTLPGWLRAGLALLPAASLLLGMATRVALAQ